MCCVLCLVFHAESGYSWFYVLIVTKDVQRTQGSLFCFLLMEQVVYKPRGHKLLSRNRAKNEQYARQNNNEIIVAEEGQERTHSLSFARYGMASYHTCLVSWLVPW